MSKLRKPAVLGAVGVLALLPGCITLFSKTDIVRPDEGRRAVKFETAEAAEKFNTVLKGQTGRVGGVYVGVPFVTLYDRDKVLSEPARFNDAVARCDTDQDGLITLHEAEIFAKVCN